MYIHIYVYICIKRQVHRIRLGVMVAKSGVTHATRRLLNWTCVRSQCVHLLMDRVYIRIYIYIHMRGGILLYVALWRDLK